MTKIGAKCLHFRKYNYHKLYEKRENRPNRAKNSIYFSFSIHYSFFLIFCRAYFLLHTPSKGGYYRGVNHSKKSRKIFWKIPRAIQKIQTIPKKSKRSDNFQENPKNCKEIPKIPKKIPKISKVQT